MAKKFDISKPAQCKYDDTSWVDVRVVERIPDEFAEEYLLQYRGIYTKMDVRYLRNKPETLTREQLIGKLVDRVYLRNQEFPDAVVMMLDLVKELQDNKLLTDKNSFELEV